MLSLSGRSNLTTTAFAVVGAVIGCVAWSGHLYTMLLVLALPLLLTHTTTTGEFWALVISYNAAATWTILPGSSVFFGDSFHPLDCLLLWGMATALLSLPWNLVRNFPRKLLWFSVPLTLIVAAVFPTGIENPLTVAGILFPHLGWYGLILTLCVFGALTWRPVYALGLTSIIMFACHIIAPGSPRPSSAWLGVDTHFGGTGMVTPDPMTSYANALTVQTVSTTSRATVTIFPETIIKNWNEANDLFWQPTYNQLGREGHTILFGSEIPGASGSYRNVLLIRGAETATFEQRIPVPMAMWHPLSARGVRLLMDGPSTITINGTKAAPIICYEQLLTMPILTSMLHRPDVILGIANDYWARNTSIPAIQAYSLAAWSRLFWIPVVSAVNQ